MGMLFISIGELFWESVRKISTFCLGIAIILFIVRMIIIFPTFSDGEMLLPRFILNILTAFEASNWILASVGFTSRFINNEFFLHTLQFLFILFISYIFLYSSLLYQK